MLRAVQNFSEKKGQTKNLIHYAGRKKIPACLCTGLLSFFWKASKKYILIREKAEFFFLVNQDDHSNDDDLFSGRGAPALMSVKEAAIRMLKERYSESFALTKGSREGQVHLFLVKLGMWALVLTFTPRDLRIQPEAQNIEFGMTGVLNLIELALNGKDEALREKLDRGVQRALERIQMKIERFKQPHVN